MKTHPLIASLTVLLCLLSASISHATWITCTNTGNWEDPTIWDSGTVPGTNDFAEVDDPYVATVSTNAIVQYIFGSGTVTMAANSILSITDPAGASGTYQLQTLNATAPGNTVVFLNNPFWASHTDYWNLVFSNTATTNLIDFYNGTVNSLDPAAAMTVHGDMTVVGKIKVQEGADFAILGNLYMGTNSQWDCSSFNMTVVSNTVMGGLMLDMDSASGADNFLGNMYITGTALGWNVSDVTNWVVGGSLTNNALIVGAGYGRINFNGSGVIIGKPFTLPTIAINGSYAIDDTITLTTNNASLNGTVIFDLANTNQINLKHSTGTNSVTTATNFYSGNLIVVDSGAPPVSGKTYKFFNGANYTGTFNSVTLPSLSGGLNWVTNLLTDGSITVSGGSGAPLLSVSLSAGQLTLSWDSASFPGYRVQAQTNSSGVTANWKNTSSSTTSPYQTAFNPANPPVFYRLINP